MNTNPCDFNTPIVLKEKSASEVSSNVTETVPNSNKNYVTIKKLQISPLETCLAWPDTTERKVVSKPKKYHLYI